MNFQKIVFNFVFQHFKNHYFIHITKGLWSIPLFSVLNDYITWTMICNISSMNYNRVNLVGLFRRLFADSLPLIIFLLFILLHVPKKNINLLCATLTTSIVDKRIKTKSTFLFQWPWSEWFRPTSSFLPYPSWTACIYDIANNSRFERPKRKPNGRKRLWLQQWRLKCWLYSSKP